jgi:hypothetical protein
LVQHLLKLTLELCSIAAALLIARELSPRSRAR